MRGKTLLYNDTTITIRSIQHFIYCPHRWGLLNIDMAWSENAYVTKANILHKNVHSPREKYSKPGVKVYNSVPVYNDKPEYDIYGVLDCLEVLTNGEKKEELSIVEHKPTMPKKDKYNYDDMMQVFAQKICVDYMFETDAKAYIYYADQKKRIQLSFEDEGKQLRDKLLDVLEHIRTYLNNGFIPPINKSVRCGGCSLRNICMPLSIKLQSRTVRSRIEEIDRCSK